MKNYRTPDQDYYDRYDGHTIKWLKEIEEEERKLYPKTIIVDKKPYTITYNPFIKRNTIGVNRSRNREETVKQWMKEDEEKDALIKNTRIPEAPRCGTCNTRMYPNGHMFDAFDHKFLFVFDCPTEQHKSRKIVQPKGEVLFIPKPKCEKCGGELTSTTKRKKHSLVFVDICKSCRHKNIHTYNLTPEEPINEEDRKKYCEYFVGRRTLMEDLKRIGEFAMSLEKKEAEEKLKEKYEVDKIEILTIPKLKDKLMEATRDSKFIEFNLEKPEINKFVIVGFSVQDPNERDSYESVKALTQALKKILLYTNWRIVNNTVSCRLGYLSGKVKAYEGDENLLKLAKEIKGN